ncbi:Uncharacterized protein TCM_014810 [Theobroma cacao]|uniref:RNase H type-1 domain-containing protein n=1 Tax=Theobroma cacao TaxID=3641 RepID=A0A061FZS0_THECC|nr:Uncharacterized protein TCM_014810 [Theobroma cacao]
MNVKSQWIPVEPDLQQSHHPNPSYHFSQTFKSHVPFFQRSSLNFGTEDSVRKYCLSIHHQTSLLVQGQEATQPHPSFSLPFQPSTISINIRKCKRKVTSKWRRPPPGSFKLNIDGSALGKPGPAGIRGAIRDHEGFIKGVFSTPIGTEDSNYAEFLAIKEGLSLFFSSPWASNTLHVDCDSKNAITWASHHNSVPWRVKLLSNSIGAFKTSFKDLSFTHINREANTLADGLAKVGTIRLNRFRLCSSTLSCFGKQGC